MASQDEARKLWDKIKDVRVAMMTTVDDDGTLHSRPMATQQAEFDGKHLWFFTRAHSHKVEELERNTHAVNITYAEPKDNLYVSVSGRAELVRDPAKIRELWSPLLKAWFPQGPDDPELALLRVDATKAEYWDASSSRMVALFGYVKAAATGQPFQAEGSTPGEHEKIDLKR